MIDCSNCGYHYKGENERFACCHFEGPEGWAPCEQDEEQDEEEEDRYTYDDLGNNWY
jgi:hypothetical protein